MPVLRSGRDGEQVTGPVLGLACRHNMLPAIPVPFSQSFRYDQIQRTAYRLFAGKAKNTLGTRVPECNETLTISRKNGIGQSVEDRVPKLGHGVRFLFRPSV